MPDTSNKTPNQLIDVLSNLLDFGDVHSLTPEVRRDLESLRVWCENAADDLDDKNVKIEELQDEVSALQDDDDDLKSALRQIMDEMLDAANGEGGFCKQALAHYAAEIDKLL